MNGQRVLRDAVLGSKCSFTRWEGGCLWGIIYPPCLRKENLLRIPWNVGDEINPIEPLLLYRYVCCEGIGYLELQLTPEGRPTFNR